MDHKKYMRRCLELAEQGRGKTGINPLVGCVLVRGDAVLAQGFYNGVGTDHAERDMFKKLDQEIQPEDRLYVNLEPCNHTGKTPPCVAAILEYQVQTVVVGMQDPDTRVAGQGIAALRAAGVNVIGPVLRAECERLNRGFLSVRLRGRPYITLKKAQTKAGEIANGDGSPKAITSTEQNTWSHTHLRTTHDAILVGVGTLLADDPSLTVRHNEELPAGFSQPWKIILDPNLRIPRDAKCLDDRTIIVTQSDEVLGSATTLKLSGEGEFDLQKLMQKLVNLNISSVLVEGGKRTWQYFKEAGLVDQEVILVG